MMRKLLVTTLFLITILHAKAQSGQVVRGTVTDKNTSLPLSYAQVVIPNTKPVLGAITDTLGSFVIKNVPPGRYDVEVTLLGYHKAMIREVEVTSGKQIQLQVELLENSAQLAEVVINPSIRKEKPINQYATVSARMLSVEEASRYAGGFDDPARLASAFAGVASNSGSNGIIVRGNAPRYLQWRMEGVEIPSPNHFNDLRAFGGGVLTALSSQMLANSDFFTGAFPAEYNNALSGVFDMNLRKGNTAKRETTLQFGLIGLEASQEGPFKKGGQSSYIFNYRYATLGLLKPVLPDGAESITYQDLSFKLNFPTQKAGTFSIWGMGLIDGANASPKKDTTEQFYVDDRQRDKITLHTGALGITHKWVLKKNAYLQTVLAATGNRTNWQTEALHKQDKLVPYSHITFANQDYTFSSFLNKRFGLSHSNRTGIRLRLMNYNLKLDKAATVGEVPAEIVNASGYSVLSSAFTNSSVSINGRLKLNMGLSAQQFSLNNHHTIEPRVGLSQTIGAKHTLAVAYGLHSRIEGLNFYFNKSLATGEKAVNKHLDFTKAHHLVLSYDLAISDLMHLKVEPYYQYLFDVPVINGTSFSSLNMQTDWFFAQKLENKGEGRNYGVDISLEKYLSNGFYYMFTLSVFEAEYKGGDGVWRNTRFNRNVVTNVLAGKEWKVGKEKRNTFHVNGRVTLQGGERYSPIQVETSVAQKQVVYEETKAFSKQTKPMMNLHLTIAYKRNKQKSSREIALKIVNLTQQPDFYGYKYNFVTGGIDQDVEAIVIPNLSYKIQF